VVPESDGTIRITVRKTDQKLGVALEGGADTKHPLPRIINVHVSTSSVDAEKRISKCLAYSLQYTEALSQQAHTGHKTNRD